MSNPKTTFWDGFSSSQQKSQTDAYLMLKKLKGQPIGLRIIDTDTPAVHERYVDEWILLHKMSAPTFAEAEKLLENWIKESLELGRTQGYLG